MASAEQEIRDVKRFVAAYRASEDDHPDLESRVAMFRRAVRGGDKREVAVHARTLLRFIGHLGLTVPKPAKKAAAKKAATPPRS